MKPKASPADALRAVPPRDFVGARNALAAQLAKDGKAAEARQVARLRRPSPVAWALNRAAAARPRELGALVDAVDRLRRAQLGGGDLRAAMERYRSAFEPLVRGASQALREAGAAVSAALDRRIRSTLLAAVTDRGLRADLEAARLADEHAEPGFAVLSGGPVPAGFLLDRPRKKHSAGPAKPLRQARSRQARSRERPGRDSPPRPRAGARRAAGRTRGAAGDTRGAVSRATGRSGGAGGSGGGATRGRHASSARGPRATERGAEVRGR